MNYDVEIIKPAEIYQHKDTVTDLAISPDDSIFASASEDKYFFFNF